MPIQQELPKNPPPLAEVDASELYEEEPRRRPWGAVTSVVLALALVFVGYQWHQTSGREQALASQVGALRAESETQRLRAEEAKSQVEGLEKRLAALATEKDGLVGRLASLEKASERRATATREPERGRTRAVARDGARPPRASATPVAAPARSTKKVR